MSIDAKISIFSAAMRTEFAQAFIATAEPAPWEDFTHVVPSSARIEHYTWMSPTPGISKYTGHRRYGKIDTIRYSVENKEFDSAFEVLLRDIEDDQIGGYSLKPKELAARAKLWPGRWTMKTLSQGKTLPCFDGTNYFADSHSIGVGDNLMTATGSANADGLVYKMVFLHHGGLLKPMIWQNRKGPRFETNSGSPQSFEAKICRYWIDLEGESAYGYWWDAVLAEVTNGASVTDLHTLFNLVEARFRSFYLPRASTADEFEWTHEQSVFSSKTFTVVGPPEFSEALRQALNSDWVPQAFSASVVAPTTNRFKGWANYIVSNYFSPTYVSPT